MNPGPRLERLRRLARSHFGRLRGETLRLTLDTPEVRKTRIPILVIDGINCWANFSRAYFLSAARGCWSSGGRRITALSLSGHSNRDAIYAAIRACAQNNVTWVSATGYIDRRWEPAWHDPNVLMKSAQFIGLSSFNDIASALSPFPKYIMDWACVRNFFAHRNGDTHASAIEVLMQSGLVSGPNISELLVQAPIGSARPLLWEWCSEIELLCEYLCW